MASYYVETVRPSFPSKVKLDFYVHKEVDFSVDCLSPGMTACFKVDNVRNSTEAVSCVMELAAGLSPCVRLVFGGRKPALSTDYAALRASGE